MLILKLRQKCNPISAANLSSYVLLQFYAVICIGYISKNTKEDETFDCAKIWDHVNHQGDIHRT